MKQRLSTLLSLCLILFVADGVASLVDETLLLVFGLSALTVARGLLSFFVAGLALMVYLLMGASPMIPKRYLLPVVLFNPLAGCVLIPLSIYHFDRIQQIAWVISLSQLVLGLVIIFAAQKRWKWHWPLLPAEKLGERAFSGWHLTAFVFLNVFVLLPGLMAYLAFSASLAVHHFSGGFLRLHREGLTVRAQNYARADGKSVRLIPMIHIGEAGFYHRIAQSLETNTVILLEGVSDRSNLLKNKLSYQRMANSLGLAEQHDAFTPDAAQARPADVDVEDFSPATIDFLNIMILVHAKGWTAETLRLLMQKSQNPALTEGLWEDLLTLRNNHLIKELQTELARTKTVVLPWGAAHMPGLSREIQALGFRPTQSQEYSVVRFQTLAKLFGSQRP